jgi:hypothetical protein
MARTKQSKASSALAAIEQHLKTLGEESLSVFEAAGLSALQAILNGLVAKYAAPKA